MSHTHNILLSRAFYGKAPSGQGYDYEISSIIAIAPKISKVILNDLVAESTKEVLCYNNHPFRSERAYVINIFPMHVNASMLDIDTKYQGEQEFMTDFTHVPGIDIANNEIHVL